MQNRSIAAIVVFVVGLGACSGSSDAAPDATPPASLSSSSTAPPESSATVPTTTVVATSSTTTTTAATTTTMPSSVPGWTVLPGAFDDVTLTDGAELEGRHVIAGCRRDAATSTVDTALPLWWSDDLANWQRGDGPAGVGCLEQLAGTPFGFFAVGTGAQLWSEDGSVWQALELHEQLDLEFQGQLGSAQAIFVSPEEARVTLLYTRAAEAESTIASLVTTTDGESWGFGLPDSAALFDSSGIADVIPGGEGLLAVGSSPGGEFVPTAAVFTSPDGLAWRRLTPRTEAFNDAVMMAIAAVGDGYVAVGGDFFQTGLMTAWTSPDGFSWTRSPHPDETTDPSVAFMTAQAITVDGIEVWASGIDSDARRADDGLPAIWVSTDAGATFGRMDVPGDDSLIPFVILEDGATTIGTWPPPKSSIEGDAILFMRAE